MVAVQVQIKQFVVLACVFRMAMADCRHSDNCEDCTSNPTWSGEPCRWCKRDDKCHAKGSLFNPCKRAENIVDKSQCDNKFSQYDPSLSYKMLLLSSAAYDPSDPQRCLDQALPSSKFKLLTVVTRECDFLDGECSGFLAISDVEKAIIVAFRGSKSVGQALKVFLEALVWPKTSFLEGEVQNYWNRAFSILWGCMESEVRALRSKYPEYQIWVTGHSLGGAIASLASTWLAHYNIAPPKDVVLYTFGMPRVGDYDYALQHDKLVKNSWRVVNYDDFVPHFPSVLSVNIVLLKGPYHHGIEAYYTAPATSVNSSHKECHGKPFNEDKSCSFTTFPYSFDNHKQYFSIPVGTYCSSVGRTKRDTSDNTRPKFKFLKDHCSVYRSENGTYVAVSKQVPKKSTKSSGKQNLASVSTCTTLIVIIIARVLTRHDV